MSTALGDSEWNGELAGRVNLMVKNGVHEAKLQLSPAELGRLEIKISTDGDQAKVLFTVQNAAAREAIEQAMPRLRDMLEQSGLQLGHSEVADQSQPQHRENNVAETHSDPSTGGTDEAVQEIVSNTPMSSSNAMVDYYV